MIILVILLFKFYKSVVDASQASVEFALGMYIYEKRPRTLAPLSAEKTHKKTLPFIYIK